MSNLPRKRGKSKIALNGIPSAMDEMQLRGLIRDLGEIEKKGLQVRGAQTEASRIYAHISEIMLHDAINESRIRDIAHEELTEEEYEQFVVDLHHVHGENQRQHVETMRTANNQMIDHVRRQPIPDTPASEDFIGEVKKVADWLWNGKK